MRLKEKYIITNNLYQEALSYINSTEVNLNV